MLCVIAGVDQATAWLPQRSVPAATCWRKEVELACKEHRQFKRHARLLKRDQDGCRHPCGAGLACGGYGVRGQAQSSGTALLHLISSMHTLERTEATPGSRMSVPIKKRDSEGRSRAVTLST